MTTDQIAEELKSIPEAKAILAIGAPGSGKSTHMSNLARLLNLEIVCTDDIREEIAGNTADQSVNAKAWEIAHDRACRKLSANTSVIIDATHATIDQRQTDVALYRQAQSSALIVGVWFNVPLEVSKHRNLSRDRVVPEHIVKRYHEQLASKPPSTDDGFDLLYVIAD